MTLNNAMTAVGASVTDLTSSPPHMLTEEEANERESHVMVMLGQGSHRDKALHRDATLNIGWRLKQRSVPPDNITKKITYNTAAASLLRD
jgi:hypothetical protein